ncbi:MAG: hypothetical protein OEZ06_29915 [Myxococcales bacterium]|nr:hypothetical protein [Myxococcales bacterium]
MAAAVSADPNLGPTATPGSSCVPNELLLCGCPAGGQGTTTCPPSGLVGVDCFCPDVGGSGTGGTMGGTGGTTGGTGGTVGGTGGADVGSGGTMGGSGGAMGSGGMMGGTGGSMVTGSDPRIPAAPASCPNLATGNVTIRGQQVQLWVGNRREDVKGSVFFYWHGTGSTSSEASSGLGSAIQEITGNGGMVASFTTSTTNGQSTANNVWYTGDFEMADDLLACAVQQLNIDTRRVYTGGCSAGGLQAGAMVYGRSSYLAAAMPNSGGVISFFAPSIEDPSHVPSVITTHGAAGVDVVGVDFADTSADLTSGIANLGGFVTNCDHGGGHCS